MHSDTLGRCSCDIRADPIKDPNRTDQNSPRKGSKGSCVREGLSKKKGHWNQENNRKRESRRGSKGCREVRDKANATDNDIRLKKRQGNSEEGLKTQLQIERKNMRVKEEKALTERIRRYSDCLITKVLVCFH